MAEKGKVRWHLYKMWNIKIWYHDSGYEMDVFFSFGRETWRLDGINNIYSLKTISRTGDGGRLIKFDVILYCSAINPLCKIGLFFIWQRKSFFIYFIDFTWPVGCSKKVSMTSIVHLCVCIVYIYYCWL